MAIGAVIKKKPGATFPDSIIRHGKRWIGVEHGFHSTLFDAEQAKRRHEKVEPTYSWMIVKETIEGKNSGKSTIYRMFYR